VIPTYNEKGNIERLIEEDLRVLPRAHIIVVDDNSPDGTGEIVDGLISSGRFGGRLSVIHRAGKLGLGTAYVQGFKLALSHGFNAFIEQDADFSHNPAYLKDMERLALKGNDLVIGSRYVKGGGVVNWGLVRRLVSLGGSTYARILLFSRIRDLTGGYNCYTRRALEAIGLDSVMSKGYAFQIEMKWRCQLAGLKIAETPIIFEDRRAGQSKMSKRIFIEAMWKVLLMALSRRRIRRTLKTPAS
jgi:dolichol-phosphate mannosyltransferase